MANINQIEIKRGTAAGTIETQLFNIGNGGSIAAYGIIDSIIIDPNQAASLILTAKLSPDYENFAFIKDELICLRIEKGTNVPSIDSEYCSLKLRLKNSTGTTTIENEHLLVSQFSDGSAYGYPAKVNSITDDMAILILCQQDDNVEGHKYYHQVADNLKPRLGSSGIMTIG